MSKCDKCGFELRSDYMLYKLRRGPHPDNFALVCATCLMVFEGRMARESFIQHLKGEGNETPHYSIKLLERFWGAETFYGF